MKMLEKRKTKAWRNLYRLAHSLEGLGVSDKSERRSYLEIAAKRSNLREWGAREPREFKELVDDYRICGFDDNKIVDEFDESWILNGFLVTLSGLSLIGLGVVARELGAPHLTEYFCYGGCLITLLGVGGMRALDHKELNRIQRVKKTSSVQRYLIDPKNNPLPNFIRDGEHLAEYSLERL